MNFDIITSDYFKAEAKRLGKRYRSFVDDYDAFVKAIRKNPYQGTEFMPGVRKVRIAIESKDRGKSGGARVITFTYAVSESNGIVYLLIIYDKEDASSVKKNVIKTILKDLGFDINKLQAEGRLTPRPTDNETTIERLGNLKLREFTQEELSEDPRLEYLMNNDSNRI